MAHHLLPVNISAIRQVDRAARWPRSSSFVDKTRTKARYGNFFAAGLQFLITPNGDRQITRETKRDASQETTTMKKRNIITRYPPTIKIVPS